MKSKRSSIRNRAAFLESVMVIVLIVYILKPAILNQNDIQICLSYRKENKNSRDNPTNGSPHENPKLPAKTKIIFPYKDERKNDATHQKAPTDDSITRRQGTAPIEHEPKNSQKKNIIPKDDDSKKEHITSPKASQQSVGAENVGQANEIPPNLPEKQPNFPIDVVYTWVNGSDPEWLKKKDELQTDKKIRMAKRVENGRFFDIGELKFSLRGLEKFIPWVNMIYIVTDQQIPYWFNTSSPKIRIIDHTKIIPKASLPTFNSNNIDFHLHLIPNLCEHFIYLNDDVFLGRPLKPSNFYNASGYPLLPVAKQIWRTQRIVLKKNNVLRRTVNDMGTNQYQFVSVRTVEVFDNKFSFHVNYRTRHGYIPLTISLLKLMWENFRADLLAVEKHHFRDANDLSMPTMAIQAGIGLGLAEVLHINNSVRYLVMVGSFSKKIREFQPDEYNAFCLNSGERTTDTMRENAYNFLMKYCPEKSSFEL